MSKMGDFRIYLTEKVMEYFPDKTWEEASDYLDSTAEMFPNIVNIWEQEYLRKTLKIDFENRRTLNGITVH